MAKKRKKKSMSNHKVWIHNYNYMGPLLLHYLSATAFPLFILRRRRSNSSLYTDVGQHPLCQSLIEPIFLEFVCDSPTQCLAGVVHHTSFYLFSLSLTHTTNTLDTLGPMTYGPSHLPTIRATLPCPHLPNCRPADLPLPMDASCHYPRSALVCILVGFYHRGNFKSYPFPLMNYLLMAFPPSTRFFSFAFRFSVLTPALSLPCQYCFVEFRLPECVWPFFFVPLYNYYYYYYYSRANLPEDLG